MTCLDYTVYMLITLLHIIMRLLYMYYPNYLKFLKIIFKFIIDVNTNLHCSI